MKQVTNSLILHSSSSFFAVYLFLFLFFSFYDYYADSEWLVEYHTYCTRGGWNGQTIAACMDTSKANFLSEIYSNERFSNFPIVATSV